MWDNLKTSIASVVRTNNNQEITGANLQSVLNTIVNAVGANATFAGIAVPSTNPSTPDGPVFYIACEPGVYSNFNLTLVDGLYILENKTGSWVGTLINTGAAFEALIGYYNAVLNGASITVPDATTYRLTVGGNFKLKMTAAGTTDTALTIGNATNIPIRYNGAVVSPQNTWEAGEIISVFYDGTYFMASNSEGDGKYVKVKDATSDLDISDGYGNVLARFSNGHFKVKNFDSEADAPTRASSGQYDLEITDPLGWILLRLYDGHIKTKNFDSKYANKSQWLNKKIICFGDSITYGVGASDNAHKYPSIISQKTGATVINSGVSGTRISDTSADSFVNRIVNIDTTANLIIICGGTNDYWHHETTIGDIDSDDNTTLCGALNYIFDWLQNNVPLMKVLFVFPMHQYYNGNKDTHDFGYGDFSAFRNAASQVCDRRGIPMLDLMSTSGIDAANSSVERTTYSADGVHPNDAGYELMSHKILQYINNVL